MWHPVSQNLQSYIVPIGMDYHRISCPLIHPIGHDVPLALGAPRSFSAICLSRSFSIVLAQAEALAATACCLNALLDLSTAKPQSTAGCCLSADCPPLTSSIILARSLRASEGRNAGK